MAAAKRGGETLWRD
ncbi:hypothetical protein RRG08_066066, partial [Elysia crispata]